jgi:hypothetical protein
MLPKTGARFGSARVDPNGALLVRRLSGTALLAATLMLGISAQAAPASAETKKTQTTAASDAAARHRRDRYAYRPAYPYPMYYGRPVTYAPAPFLPIPPLFGYGWEWW